MYCDPRYGTPYEWDTYLQSWNKPQPMQWWGWVLLSTAFIPLAIVSALISASVIKHFWPRVKWHKTKKADDQNGTCPNCAKRGEANELTIEEEDKDEK
ncbi:unnamed protein product [Zymoseptoria tritici ST99CH_1A5]|uniref:Uncharacterized protein n=3 Tax=Zymoseptoria tritici TaxID=1047171 RepID=A0A1X7RXA0_ZYMT9|nr:unnamed protein product [Zymoseptoria tritici ST99CH_3D7]SMR54355.1 unnamed protein product [Zymoseptoria tritici ST99CH_1E4]SMR56342.1 unnamed protein product [Zymoseptoria tritici ST99CH_3D1]SMY25525.1 unnamed protein product [Zymoseptoria tritici ST99CH_1A5]